MKILAANRLHDGIAIWLGAGGKWVEDINDADVVHETADAEELLAIAREAVAANLVVEAEMIDVDLVDGKIRPRRLRERIRAAGPSIHPKLGKQATRRPALQLR